MKLLCWFGLHRPRWIYSYGIEALVCKCCDKTLDPYQWGEN